MGATKPFDSVVVRPIHREEVKQWKEYLNRYHYLGCRGIAGRSLRYVATIGNRWVALLGWGSAALKCTVRDRFIGWDDETKIKRLYLVVNNVRFLVLPGESKRNLASKVLSLNLKRLSDDFQAVYVYPLCKEAKEILCGDFIAYDFSCVQKEGNMKQLVEFPVESLMGEIQQVKDPRKKRGIRHQVAVVLGIAVCAVLCGSRSFRAIGDWAKALRKEDLRRFRSNRKKAPSEPTIRRVVQSIDAEEFDERIGGWVIRQRMLPGKAIAMDGKTLCGSHDGEQSAVHLLSAVVHKEGIVVAQQRVDSKTNEITRVKPLLEELNIEGGVVTADALLTQKHIAEYVVTAKHADYVFTVKGNQPTLFDDIRDLDLKKKARTTRSPTKSTGDLRSEQSG